MPLDTLTWLLRGGERHAHRILLKDRMEMLEPLFHLVVPEQQDVVFLCEWKNVNEKLATMAAVRQTSHDLHATAALFITEAWIIKRQGPLIEEVFETPPSQSPDRIEVVAMFATDGKDTKSVMLQIVRDKPGGKIIALVKEKDSEGTHEFSGRMIDDLIRVE